MCHYCPGRAKQLELGELRTTEPMILETLDVNFFGKLCCRGEMSGCHYCASPAKKMGDLLSSRKKAVRETAKHPCTVQQCTCYYCPSRAKQLGDLRTAAQTILETIDVNFFWQILLPW